MDGWQRPELRHVDAGIARDEFAQKGGIGGREGLEDGLVGIADSHPIAVLANQAGKDLLLDLAGVLRFIFQDVGPAMTETIQKLGGGFEQLKCKADEVIEVDGAAIGQGALVIGVDLEAHGCQAAGEWGIARGRHADRPVRGAGPLPSE